LQWDLVCDRAYLKDLTQTILTVGQIIGPPLCAPLSDKFGRKPIFLISQWAMVIVGVANAFAPNYYIFIVLRFVTGILYEVRTTKFRFFCDSTFRQTLRIIAAVIYWVCVSTVLTIFIMQ